MRHAIILALIVCLLATPAAVLAGSCSSSCRTTSSDTQETSKHGKAMKTTGACPVTGARSMSPTSAPEPSHEEAAVPSLIQPHEGLINTPGLLALIQARAPMVLLDARSAKWDDGKRIPGAKSLTADASLNEIRKHIKSQDQLIVTYCSGLTCPASRNLSERLKKLGYKNVIEYPEGIKGWMEAGHPVERAKK